MSALVVPSGECLRGVVDWGSGVFASCCRGSNCLLARATDGRISRSAATSDYCKARLVRFRPCKTRYTRITAFRFGFSFIQSRRYWRMAD